MNRSKLGLRIRAFVSLILSLLIGLTTAMALLFSIGAFFVAITGSSIPLGYVVGTLSSVLGFPVGVTTFEVAELLMKSASEVIFRKRE